MTESTTALTLTTEDITAWVDRYLVAWRTNDAADIAALFTEDGEYHESPYETDWVGRSDIVDGWRGRWNWQKGGWTFEWRLESLDGATAVITGIGRYTELGDFDNHWTLDFATPELVSGFRMINNERPDA